MSIQTRLTRLEKLIDPNLCYGCGKAPGYQVTPEEAERSLQKWVNAGMTREEAIAEVAGIDPAVARALGFPAPWLPEQCRTCGERLQPWTGYVTLEQAERTLSRFTDLGLSRAEAIAEIAAIYPVCAAPLLAADAAGAVTPAITSH